MKIIPLLIAGCLSASSVLSAARPNVILMMTDDQGYGEIAAHGNSIIDTPHLDKLHAESIRLIDFHVDPTCAPTRGATMTGKYSHRARVWHTVRGGNHLRASEVTMADVFLQNGYHTAMFGKWHLGANYPYRPMDRGFEEWLGLGDGGPNTSDCYFWNDRVNDVYIRNGEREFVAGYNPDVFYRETINYVKNYKSEKPFFIYLPTYIPHKPYTFPAPDFHQKYLDQGLDKELAAFYACIERVDWNIGELRKALEETGLAENTILIFMTDNGSSHGKQAFNAGMSGGKGSTADGGHRVPCFISWPKGELGEPRDIEPITAHIDLLPTLIDLCAMQAPKAVDFDGISLGSLLRNEKCEWPDRTIIVEKQREEIHNRKYNAIMTSRWRLLSHSKLFDIKADPAQKTNVAKQYPEVVKRLMQDFDAYWEHVTVDDRSYPKPIAGTQYDEEILLSVSELREGSGYAHGYIAEANEAKGIWHVEASQAGTYEFEVRRWPVEAAAPFSGQPTVPERPVDAWSSRGPKTTFLTKGKITAIPVAEVSLRVGDVFSEKRTVSETEEAVVFDVELPKGVVELESIFYDASGKRLTHAYYVYVRLKQS